MINVTAKYNKNQNGLAGAEKGVQTHTTAIIDPSLSKIIHGSIDLSVLLASVLDLNLFNSFFCIQNQILVL